MINYLTVKDQLSGLYTIRKDGAELARGNYLNGKRVGNWYFFSYNKELALRYNYDSGKILFADEKLLAAAAVKVYTDTESVRDRASVPVPVFSIQQYYYLATAAATAEVPEKDLKYLDKENVVIVAHISSTAEVTYEVRYILKGGKQQTRTFQLDKGAFKIDWIPSTADGKTYDSDFFFLTRLSATQGNQEGHKRFSWY
ncbi:hypothetical protein [Pedobacter sp. SYP-B3415]|uniref:hypothetical protein n=1 Tax=Pedobacter sp. SYP-B3415 TaxID=2496641 RepID=UPI00101D70E2|nr:hypothetical protein [Pedobacter sp. SYP-B3415]